jgi:rRNA maturation RNase YbeY
MKIEISNRQKKSRISSLKLRSYARWLLQQVQELDPDHPWISLSVILTDNQGMPRMHAAAMGRTKNTDVISYAYPPGPDVGPGYHGEVVVNVERAVELGPRFDGVELELALYLAHGCHHLTGADDHSPLERRRMRKVENRWLEKADAKGLIKGLMGS